MSVLTAARHVRNDEGDDVTISSTYGEIVVRWYCGDTRTFKPKAIENVFEHLKLLRDHPDAKMTIVDARDTPIDVRIVDGKLFVASSGTPVDVGDLRKAVKRTVKDLK